jgi:hypothetical protein
LTPQRRASTDRVRRRAAGVRAAVLALAAVVCVLACAPAVGAHAGAAAAVLDGGGAPGPGRGPGADVPDADAPDRDAPDEDDPDDDDLPRPIATRPPGVTAPPGAAAAMLAVRGLRVPAHVALATARAEGIGASFVPRPGSLVAEVRLSAGGGRLVARRLVAVRAGRRAIAHVRAIGLRRGAYEVSVRAGAVRATLGPAVVARVRVG